MKREFRLSSRREFFGQSASALTVLSAIATQRGRAAEKGASNPFACDVSRLQRTDPN
jgi:hypothetical protein